MMLPRYAAAERLERRLGDARMNDNPLSFASSRRLDESEAWPAEHLSILQSLGVGAYCVPAAFGGAIRDAAEAAAVLRCIARRDITTAHQLGNNLLGSLPVWIGGDDGQRRCAAARLLAGERMAFGLTERTHGADVLANELSAARDAAGYRLRGEKYLISQATVADAISVVARTGAPGDARGHSLFVIHKHSMPKGAFEALPKMRTLGLRGADIGGFRLENALVNEDALIGAEGDGLDLSVRTLLVSKVLVCSLSLGAVETALSTVLAFAHRRVLYGGLLTEIPHARSTLAGVFAEYLVIDAFATYVARAMSTQPDRLGVLSNVVKVVVPEICDTLLRELATILGARFYMRHAHDSGIFEKMLRDSAIISVFDGSSIVCSSAISVHLTRAELQPSAPSDTATADLRAALPPIDFAAVGVANSRTTVEDFSPFGVAPAALPFAEAVTKIPERVHDVRSQLGRASTRSAELYEVARDYSLCVAAAAACDVWRSTQTDGTSFFGSGDWLSLGLERLARRLSWSEPRRSRTCVETTFGELERRHWDNESFGVLPIRVPSPGTRPSSA